MKKKKSLVRLLWIVPIAVVALIAVLVGYGVFKQKANALSMIFNDKTGSPAVTALDSKSESILDDKLQQVNGMQASSGSLVVLASPVVSEALDTAKPNIVNSDVVDLLVLGVDSREFQLDSQTDLILLIRVEKNKKSVKIVSFSRDIYLSIPGYTDNRINEANVYAGPELVMKTLNQTFGLNIQNYIVFDFKTAEEMIDMIGKVTISVKPDELDGMNGRIAELNSLSNDGSKAAVIPHSGIQELNGRQAVAYASFRPSMVSDIVRMGRERDVLLSLAKSAKKLKTDQVPSLADKAMEMFYTNLPMIEFPSFAMDMFDARDSTIQQCAIPVSDTYKEVQIVGMKYLVIDFRQNKSALAAFLNG